MLKVSSLSFSYSEYTEKKSEPIFSNLSFSVEEGEKLLILAPPESGKTTLSFLLSGIKLDGIETGSVKYNDKDVSIESVTLVPQNTNEYIIQPRVEDEIAFSLENLGLTEEEMKKRVSQSLSLWGLEKLKDASPDTLSGGEKRRLLIATALVSSPRVVIYDEAFDDLDYTWREKLKDRINDRKETSIVFASRYIEYFSSLFDKIYVIENKKLTLWNGKKEEIVKPIKGKSENKAILSVSNLSFSYPESMRLPFSLSVKSFELKSESVVSLLGLNGSGKSTFSHILCGLEEKISGDVKINNREASPSLLRRSVGYIFQNPDLQIFLPTVRDELMYSFSFLPLSKEEKNKRVEEACSLFSLNPESIASLMGYGERKRLQCAVYYTLSRPFYIIDELDSALTYSMCTSILNNLLKRGAGILLITHDRALSNIVSDSSYIAEDGIIHEE